MQENMVLEKFQRVLIKHYTFAIFNYLSEMVLPWSLETATNVFKFVFRKKKKSSEKIFVEEL